MKWVHELECIVQDGDDQRPFQVRIGQPTAVSGEEEYSCRVHAPALFKRDKEIFGADPEQALELAVDFVKSMLKDKTLVDHNGRKIEIGRWPNSR
ncbi:MAG TPA: hypothetical protein P5528_10590 [Steroidobacteraceae bacterium]|nr:hypothetical protein [Steroidobacteraceae bacterium]HRX89881.1 hypothetical protein [Steroidobacteraceae bacterium]